MQTSHFAEFDLSRLMLGTVQFGLSYGIANKAGQPSYEEVCRIIATAYEGGVNCLDTAAVYGTSEETLGRALADLGIADRMTIATKVTQLADDVPMDTAAEIIEESVVESLKRLRLECLPICMFHREENFQYIEPLLKLKERGLVKHIGSSVMTPSASLEIIRSGHAEMMQLPTSVLDSRFTRGGVLEEGSKRGMGMFIRSIYLQGLLLMPEDDVLPELAEVIPIRRKLAALAGEAGITLAELAVRYLLGDSRITCLVVGVDTVEQMKENAALFAKGPLDAGLETAIAEVVPDLPERILAPNQWPRKMTTTLKTGK